MVSTQDSESCDPSSNLGGTFHNVHFRFAYQKSNVKKDLNFETLISIYTLGLATLAWKHNKWLHVLHWSHSYK